MDGKDERIILKERFENSDVGYGSIEIPPFDIVPLPYVNEGKARNLRQCMFYIKRNRGTSYNGLDKKGRIVRKFLSFLVDPIVCKQNGIDNHYTEALSELYRLNKERAMLHNRINELEAKLTQMELER